MNPSTPDVDAPTPIVPPDMAVVEDGGSAGVGVVPGQVTVAHHATMPRLHDLDALRAFAMFLGIALHAAMAYLPAMKGGTSGQDDHPEPGFAVLFSAIHGFRMPLFFLISGFFTAMLWRRRGLRALLRQRFARIVVPLALSMVTVIPVLWITIIASSVIGSQGRDKAKGDEAKLWEAAAAGDLAAIAKSLDAGADPDGLQAESGAPALAIAAWHGHVEAIELLLSRGAEVDRRGRDGSTALQSAAFFGRADAARALVEHGADPKLKNQNGEAIADTLQTGWFLTQLIAGIAQVKVDEAGVTAGRQQIARLLGIEQAVAPKSTARVVAEGLWMFLTMFPLFFHLWFLWFLCWFVAIFAGYARLAERFAWKVPAWLVSPPGCLLWLIPLTCIPQAMMSPTIPTFGPDTALGILPMPSVFLFYMVFFFSGVLLFDGDEMARRVGRWWGLALAVALLVAFPLGYELTVGGLGLGLDGIDPAWRRPIAVVAQVAYAWLMTFGLMGLFRSVLPRENRTIRYLSDSAYWLYLVHLTPIFLLQAVVKDWNLPDVAKFLLVCIVTTALLLASYQWLVRYTFIGRLLNGPRKRPDRAGAVLTVSR